MALIPSDGWSYYKTIDISDTGNVSADYQMKLTIYSGAGDDSTADGKIYCDNKCLDFHDDIRFGTTNNPATATQLKQWVESSDASTAVIWIKCPTDGANTFYMFIGRTTTDVYSDGANTFLFFDDFPGDSIDTDKWGGDTGDCSVAGSVVTLTVTNGDKYVFSTPAGDFGPAVRYRAYERHPDASNSNAQDSEAGFRTDDSWTDVIRIYQYDKLNWVLRTHEGGSQSTYVEMDALTQNWAIHEIRWVGTDRVYADTDDGTEYTQTSYVPGVAIPVYFRAYASTGNTCDIEIDWVFVAKYASPVPSWSSFGPWGVIRVPRPTAAVGNPYMF